MRAITVACLLGLFPVVACSGDDGGGTTGGATTDDCGFAPCDTSVTTAGSGSSGTAGSGSGTTGGAVMPCSSFTDEATCMAGDPGNGQVCDWVAAWPATLDAGNASCQYGDPFYLCVQKLGETGGTPFGSCGGDGTPPVYWRDGETQVELLGSDGFFTPDGFSPCDCHDGTADVDDPPECCCACLGGWPPG